MPSLQQKLGIQEGMVFHFVNVPDHYFDWIELSSASLNIPDKVTPLSIDFMHIFSQNEVHLIQSLDESIPFLNESGMLWISWKKGFPPFNRETIRNIGLSTGLVDVKVCSINEQWSGLKFVYRLKDRQK